MHLPVRWRGLRWLTAVWGLYAAVWISLEGNLLHVTVLGVSATAVLLGHGLQRWAGGRQMRLGVWVTGTAAAGALWGALSPLLTLLLMVLKTGLHAHGPEFAPAEISWVLQQVTLWAWVGLFAGAGLGLLATLLPQSPHP